MSFLSRIFGPTPTAAPVSSQHEDDAFGSGLDEHAHLIVARWSSGQRAEYLGYGVDALVACRALEEGRFDEADRGFAALLRIASAPVHLLRDAGRAKLLLGDRFAAEQIFVRFLDASDASTDRERRFETRVDLATIADERGEIDRAIEWLSDQLEESGDPSATLVLGRYLRQRGFFDEALDVVRGLLGGEGPGETAVLEEAGLCEFGRGDLRSAERYLGEVLRRAQCSCGKKVPEATGIALAALYETTGRPQEAAEILRNIGGGCRT